MLDHDQGIKAFHMNNIPSGFDLEPIGSFPILTTETGNFLDFSLNSLQTIK